MSFLFGGRPQPSSAEKIAQAEMEFEMVMDAFSRLNTSCMRKCLPTDYREGELNKAESVCLDRCAAKFVEVSLKVSEKFQQDAAAAQRGQGGATGGMFGM